MPRFDFQCPECGRIRELSIPSGLPDYLLQVHCGTCPGKPDLIKLPAAPNFTIKGYSAQNGYSK